jgi:hypothetical protein
VVTDEQQSEANTKTAISGDEAINMMRAAEKESGGEVGRAKRGWMDRQRRIMGEEIGGGLVKNSHCSSRMASPNPTPRR